MGLRGTQLMRLMSDPWVHVAFNVLTSVNAITFGLEDVLCTKVFSSCSLFVRLYTLV